MSPIKSSTLKHLNREIANTYNYNNNNEMNPGDEEMEELINNKLGRYHNLSLNIPLSHYKSLESIGLIGFYFK